MLSLEELPGRSDLRPRALQFLWARHASVEDPPLEKRPGGQRSHTVSLSGVPGRGEDHVTRLVMSLIVFLHSLLFLFICIHGYEELRTARAYLLNRIARGKTGGEPVRFVKFFELKMGIYSTIH